jgi:serine/threonine protein kinase
MFECALGMQYLHGVTYPFTRGSTTDINSHCCHWQRDINHGSLKPTNILVADNGQACISDYDVIEITRSGSTCARYFSPEAWKGVCPSPLMYFYILIYQFSGNFQTFRCVCICDEFIRGVPILFLTIASTLNPSPGFHVDPSLGDAFRKSHLPGRCS